jgi:PAS domain S-box-containing protein
MNSILFLDDTTAERPGLALASFRALNLPDLTVVAASSKTGPQDGELASLLQQKGLLWPADILSVDDLDLTNIDIVVVFTDSSRNFCPPLPGMPAVVKWTVSTPDSENGQRQSWRKCIEQIQAQVHDLMEQGYLAALTQARKNAEQVMDSMQEGIIAHDLNRRIFFFNQAAERITGFSRREIIGQDCHDIFSGGICSKRCSFKEPGKKIKLPDSPYSLSIKNKNGQGRELEMSVVEMKNFFDIPIGVVASFRDATREVDLATRLGEVDHFSGIIGNSPKMLAIYQSIRDLADSNVPVFIEGESGSGKELVATAIHNERKEERGLFVPVNCGALPENLLEAELFGHVKGAFTGAIRDKKGRFELADGGTIFLDEIGDITPAMQVKLLRVLQDGTFQKVGGESTIRVKVRLITATNKNIQKEISEGRFREDLYYRICVAPVKVPPLRERKSDIPLLARYFLKHAYEDEKRHDIILAQDTIETLMAYNWPGNVRELQNAVRYLMFKCQEEIARPHHLPDNIRQMPTVLLGGGLQTKKRQKLNSENVRQALLQADNNRVQAARLLNVGRATLYRFLAKHPIDLD